MQDIKRKLHCRAYIPDGLPDRGSVFMYSARHQKVEKEIAR